MTGAGSATLAFAHEQDLAGSLVDSDGDGNPEYYKVGRNPSVTDLELSNTLQRMREGDSVEAVDSVAQNLEGAVSVEATVSKDVHSEIEKLVFNDGGSGFTSGLASSATFYTGVDYIGGTAERALSGCIPLEYSLEYEQDGMATYSLSMAYANESKNTSITPSNIIGPSDGGDVPFHGWTLTVDGAHVAKLQSASLSISNIARYHWGDQRTPIDAVLAAPETTLDATVTFDGPSRLELAYGSPGASTTQDSLSSVSGSVELAVGGSTVSTYNLPKLKPDTYSWTDLINSDEDLTDETSFHVNGGVTVS
jgi:hypothetical protein